MRPPLALIIPVFLALTSTLSGQQQILLLWPNGNPEPSKVTGPEIDPTTAANRMVSGKVTVRIANVSHPNMAVYLADAGKTTGVAALVFPGGGYSHLAYNIQGAEVFA